MSSGWPNDAAARCATPLESTDWLKVNIKRRIRLAFPARIRRIIYRLGQNTNTPAANLLPLIAATVLLSQFSQTNLGEFPSSPSAVSPEKQYKSIGNETSTEESKLENEERIVMYRRVSTDEQKHEGHSLESQEVELTAILDRRPNATLFENIADEGKSGTDFRREGIQKVGRLARRDDVTHLMVDTIDRIGRTVPETLMFIDELRDDHDVKLLCRQDELDMYVPEDRLQIIMKSTMAEFSTLNRARSATRSAADNFLKQKNWRSWFRENIPLGYKPCDGWIEPIDDWEPIIEEIFNTFIDERGYEPTADKINKKLSEKIQQVPKLEEVIDLQKYSIVPRKGEKEQQENKKGDESKIGIRPTPQLIDGKLDGNDVKSIVTNPVYQGSPTLRIDYLQHHSKDPSHEDGDLSFIDDDTFAEAQEVVAEIKKKYSSDKSKKDVKKSYVEEFNPHIIESISPMIQLQCPVCDEPLVSNGQRTSGQQKLGEYTQRVYRCQTDNCSFKEKRWPKESEIEMMKLLHRLDDFHDLSVE